MKNLSRYIQAFEQIRRENVAGYVENGLPNVPSWNCKQFFLSVMEKRTLELCETTLRDAIERLEGGGLLPAEVANLPLEEVKTEVDDLILKHGEKTRLSHFITTADVFRNVG